MKVGFGLAQELNFASQRNLDRRCYRATRFNGFRGFEFDLGRSHGQPSCSRKAYLRTIEFSKDAAVEFLVQRTYAGCSRDPVFSQLIAGMRTGYPK
jgi:hypothetical protein